MVCPMALITTETAREMSARGLEAKRQAALLRANGEPAKPLLPDEKYRILRLSRVRRQLDKIDDMIADEDDPQRLDRLASAQMRLSEQERQLSGRSLPPTLRPKSGKPDRRNPSLTDSPEPVQASPAPVSNDTVTPALTSVNALPKPSSGQDMPKAL